MADIQTVFERELSEWMITPFPKPQRMQWRFQAEWIQGSVQTWSDKNRLRIEAHVVTSKNIDCDMMCRE